MSPSLAADDVAPVVVMVWSVVDPLVLPPGPASLRLAFSDTAFTQGFDLLPVKRGATSARRGQLAVGDFATLLMWQPRMAAAPS